MAAHRSEMLPHSAARERRALAAVRTLAARGACALSLIWAGMLIGVSFLAAPARFQAASLTRPVGLDVAREVFGAFNTVEIGLALLAVLLALAARARRAVWLALAILCLIVAVQALWLLPVLDARVDLILQGVTPPAGPWHAIYGGLEVVKLVVLLATALLAIRPRARPAAQGTT